ncbi:20708_t:CDS:2, partial [Gigaspora margarita]
EAKLEEKKDKIVSDYMKPGTHALSSEKNENISLTINMDTINQKKTIVNMVSNIEQAIFPSAPSSLTIEQELRDKLIIDDPSSKQYLEKDTFTKSGDIVIETIKNETEFTISTVQENIALDFIKEQYTKIYKKEDIDLDVANSITQNLLSVLEQENLAL